MTGNNQKSMFTDYQIALGEENQRLKEAIEKALQLLDAPAVSAVQSLMGRQASGDLSRAIRILAAAVPGRQLEKPAPVHVPARWPVTKDLQVHPTRTP